MSAEENMEKDAQLLGSLKNRERPILHLYDWEADSATYGHFINPAKFFDLEAVSKKKLHLARRSTGGGIVFHLWDLAFSVLVPAKCSYFSKNTLENYAFVNEAVLGAVKDFLGQRSALELICEDTQALSQGCQNFCMARPTKYDVMLGGRKVAGAAQRQTKEGFLHQGTVALIMPSFTYLKEVLLEPDKIIEGMQMFTCPLLGEKGGG
jgi:lipoate-protein ligase A